MVVGGGIRVGYPWGTTNEDVLCSGNYCDHGFVVRDFRKATVTKNTLVAESTVASLEGAGNPSKLKVIVRPNAHERGRAHVAVLNPASSPEVEVDLSRVLSKGLAFRIVSAKDYFGPAVVSGVYEGQAVRVPMKPVEPPAPVGMPGTELPVTEPQFAAFVVLPAAR